MMIMCMVIEVSEMNKSHSRGDVRGKKIEKKEGPKLSLRSVMFRRVDKTSAKGFNTR